MRIVTGPVLGFRGREDGNWKVCVLVVTEGQGDAPGVSWSSTAGGSGQAPSTELKTLGVRTVRCAELAVPQGEQEQSVSYRIAGFEASFEVPGTATQPRFAFTSCNGFSHPRLMKMVDEPLVMWKDMTAWHEEKPYHLILMGGDQVYADAIWEVAGSLKRWSERPAKERFKAAFTATMRRQVERFYFDLYCDRFGQRDMVSMLSRVPTVMMWDDHDIFDGWGSYPAQQQESAVYQGIFELAREHFCLFQLKAKPQALPSFVLPGSDGYNSVFDLGDVAVAVLDLRSERTWDQVMSPASWDAVLPAIDRLGEGGHLLVISSIPVVYLDLGIVEKGLALVPGQQELEDDLQDHWRARSHQLERLRMLHRLLEFASKKQRRVTILSGDVHIAALGVAESIRGVAAGDNSQIINQLISSGIVHPPPPALAVWAYERIGDQVEVDRGIEARLLKFPGTRQRFIGARNWLSLRPDPSGRIWAEWRAEGQRESFSKVIHPVSGG